MSLNLSYSKVNKIFSPKTASEIHALKDVSFEIKPGELFCLLGPSGCGKTTLLRSTAGLESLTSGKIYYGETDMSAIPPFRRNIGMVFQSFALYPHMNIFENVAYGLRVRKTPENVVRRKVKEVMDLVGLADELKRNPSPMELSGGQQQRVAIARALVYDPEILLLDEPLANLDAKLRRFMRAEIRRIQKATDITTIFVTHDQEEAMAIGDRLAVLKQGVVKQIGSSDQLYSNPANAFVASFIGKMNFFNARRTGPNAAVIDGTDIAVEAQDWRIKADRDAKAVIIGARPEQLLVSKTSSGKSIEGEVLIIQHLGQFVRYEVRLPEQASPSNFEIDMPHLVEDIKEHDKVFVSIKDGYGYFFNKKGEAIHEQ